MAQIVTISTNARLVPTIVPLIKSVPTVTGPMNASVMTDSKNQMENASVRQKKIKKILKCTKIILKKRIFEITRKNRLSENFDRSKKLTSQSFRVKTFDSKESIS